MLRPALLAAALVAAFPAQADADLDALRTELQQLKAAYEALKGRGVPFDDEPQVMLDPINPQSELSDHVLALFQEVLETQPGVRERFVRHYELWKQAVDDPSPSTTSGAPERPVFSALQVVCRLVDRLGFSS